MEYSDVIYAVCTALIVGLGFILEIRRQRSEERRTDPGTEARLARIEAADPVRDAMERIAKLEAQLESLNERFAAFEAALDDAAQELVVPPAKPARRARSGRR